MASGIDISVSGADRLASLGAALRAAGDKDLRRELLKAMQRSAKPLKAAAREAAATRLPRRGGLAERVAGSRFSAKTRTAGKNAGVRIVGASDLDLRSMDRGRLRHPVYGHRRWVNQQIPAGWFSDALEERAPAVRVELVKAIDEVAKTLRSKT